MLTGGRVTMASSAASESERIEARVPARPALHVAGSPSYELSLRRHFINVY